MYITSLVNLVIALSTSPLFTGSVAGAAVNPHPWIKPGPGDVRSPCPGLNTLANHGILPRNGKGLTVPMLNSALLSGYNVGMDFSTVIGSAGLLSSPTAPLATSFDLDNLDKHNFPIEHDASLSRLDLQQTGDNHSFNNATWQTVLAYVQGQSTFTIPTAAKAKYNRVQTQAKTNPTFTYTPLQFVLSCTSLFPRHTSIVMCICSPFMLTKTLDGETALYLSVMGDPITGIAPVSYVRTFFEQERLPYAEGWKAPSTQTNLLTLGDMVLRLNQAAGEEVPEGLILGASTLKTAFSGLDPITGLLPKLKSA